MLWSRATDSKLRSLAEVMGVRSLKALFKEQQKLAFQTVHQVTIHPFVVADTMTMWYTFRESPMTMKQIAGYLLIQLKAMLCDKVDRVVVVLADKEGIKTQKKKQEQLKRDETSEIEPYPQDVEITPTGIRLMGKDYPDLSVPRMIRVRQKRKEFFRQVTRTLIEDPSVCFPKNTIGSFVLDMVEGDRPVVIHSPYGTQEKDMRWLDIIKPHGEGDLAMLEYMRVARASEAQHKHFTLVTADSDVLPIFFREFQNDPKLQGNWIGYREEKCDLGKLFRAQMTKGWTWRSCILVGALTGCDFIDKDEVARMFNPKFVADSVHNWLKSGLSITATFEEFDKFLRFMYIRWVESKTKKAAKTKKVPSWQSLEKKMQICPHGSQTSPPYNEELRRDVYERVKWLILYWKLEA